MKRKRKQDALICAVARDSGFPKKRASTSTNGLSFVFDSLQSRPCQILREARSYFLLCCHHIPRFEQLIINLTTLILLGRVFMP